MPAFRPNTALARIGISLFFFTNGAIFAGLLPRFPEVKDLLGLTNTQFGIMVIANSIGAMCSLTLPARAIRRFGARAASLWGTVVLTVVMGFTGIAAYTGNPLYFGVLIFCSGLTDSVVDNAQNTHAMRVQHVCGRSIINSLHALWSAGAVAGGLVGTWLAAIGVPLYIHMPVASGALMIIAALAVKLSQIPEAAPVADIADSDRGEATPVRNSPFLRLVPLALIGIAGIQIEIVGNDWSANYMVDSVGWRVSDAGVAYVVLVIAQFVGRVFGDSMVNRWGRSCVARAGLILSSFGFFAAAMVPCAPVALPAFAAAGFGSATIVPAVFATAHNAPGYREGSSLTFVSWVMRAGNLFTSPLIGIAADALSLRWAILVPLVLAGVVQFFIVRLNEEDNEASVARALAAESSASFEKLPSTEGAIA